MQNDAKSATADILLRKLADSSPNDAVKLLFFTEDDISRLDGLNLSLLTAAKRSPGGAVELKFVDKLEVLRVLAECEKEEANQENGGANFFEALDKSAALLKSEDKPNEI